MYSTRNGLTAFPFSARHPRRIPPVHCPDEWVVHLSVHHQTSRSQYCLSHLSPTSEWTKQIEVLNANMDNLAGHPLTSSLSFDDVHVFYQSIYTLSICYAFPALSIDEKHLEEIQTRSIEALLIRKGFNHYFSRRITHGPQVRGGLGILDIKTESGLSQIKEFRHALYGDFEPGKLMMYSLKYSQMESGLGFHLLKDPKVFNLVAYSALDHVVASVSLQSQHYYHFDGLLAFPSLLQARPVFDGAGPKRKILQLLRIQTYQLCTYASPSCHPAQHL